MKPTLLSELWATVCRHTIKLVLASLLVAASNLLLVVAPLVFRHALLSIEGEPDNGVLSQQLDRWLGTDLPLQYWVLLLLVMSVVAAWFKYRMRHIFVTISYRSERVLRDQLFARIQAHSRPFYDRHGVGDLMSYLTNDVSAVREVLGPGILYPINFASLAIPALWALFYIEPRLALLSIVPIALLPFVMWLARSGMYRLSKEVQQVLARLSSLVQEQLTAIRLVKSYHAEQSLLRKFTGICQQLFTANFRLAVMQGVFFPVLGLVTRCTTVALVLLTGYVVISGWNDLTSADFVSFMWVQSYLFMPVLMLGWILPVYERGRAAHKRLWDLYEEPVERNGEGLVATNFRKPPSVTLKDVHFSYADDLPVIAGVHLHVPAGGIVGITGPVGAGKSTLLQLIAREYRIGKGKIYLNEVDCEQLSSEQLQQSISLVEQDPFLFSKTIEENLLMGNTEVGPEKLDRVIGYSQLAETIREFPDHLETMVGERGVTLSGGQKQRMVFARALLADRPILLLDDLFSGVDASTEQRILSHLLTLSTTHTIIIVAHRASVLDRLDHLFFMHHGKIVEEGSPQQLREQGGYYSALTGLQGWGAADAD